MTTLITYLLSGGDLGQRVLTVQCDMLGDGDARPVYLEDSAEQSGLRATGYTSRDADFSRTGLERVARRLANELAGAKQCEARQVSSRGE